jgi:hypothetical protein
VSPVRLGCKERPPEWKNNWKLNNFYDYPNGKVFINNNYIRNDMNEIHQEYIRLFGSSPHNRTVRIDKNKLTIIGIDNEIIDEFKNWKEMKMWLENTQYGEHEKIFNKGIKCKH